MEFLRSNWQYIIISIIVLLVGIIILYKKTTFEFLENTSHLESYLNKDISLVCDYKNSQYYLSITPLSSCSNLKPTSNDCLANVATLQKISNIFSVFHINRSFSDTKKYKLMSTYSSRPYLSQNLNLSNKNNMLCFDNGEGNMVYFELDSSDDNKYVLKFMKNDKPYYVTVCDKKCESNMRVCLTDDINVALKFSITSVSTQQHSDTHSIGTTNSISNSSDETNKLPVNSEK